MSTVKRLPTIELQTILGDPREDQPLYRQLYFSIRGAILSGRWPPLTRLPSSRQLARELSLARNTVINAYDQLLDEGFITVKHGSGSYVSERLPDRYLQPEPTPARGPGPRHGAPGLSKRGKDIGRLDSRAQFGRAIPFAPGVPEMERFPLETWTRLVAKHWRGATKAMLSYAHPAGYEPLREAISDYLRACRAVRCLPEQVMVVSGAQQVLDLTARLLVDPGDPVWVEEPGYHGARGALRAAGGSLIPVLLDEEGLDLDRGKALCPTPRLIYITPSHQYPSCVTMSLARRLNLLDFARAAGAWIVEDDYDSEYRYSGRPLASLQGLDEDGRVIYTGTFSKVLVPSLRLGYLVAPKPLLEAFWNARSYMDGYPPTIIQAALAEFMREGFFTSHIRRMRGLYQQRQQILLDALTTVLADWLTVTASQAGMHLIARPRQPFDDLEVANLAGEVGLQLRPLSSFFLGRPQDRGLVMGYAGYDETAIRAGVLRMANIFSSLQGY